MAQLCLLAITLNVWVLVGILTAAFAVQFWLGEPPRPLCVMQRIAFALVGLGLLHILLGAYTTILTTRLIAVGQGMAIIAALLGALAASRQILLHILPGDRGFGSPVFGIHIYTWCFIAFSCQIAASAILLIMTAWLNVMELIPSETSLVIAGAWNVAILKSHLGSRAWARKN